MKRIFLKNLELYILGIANLIYSLYGTINFLNLLAIIFAIMVFVVDILKMNISTNIKKTGNVRKNMGNRIEEENPKPY